MDSTVVGLGIGLFLLGLATRYLATLVLTGKQKFSVGHPFGLHAAALRASEEAWDIGHRAARPLLIVTIVLAVVDAFAIVVVMPGAPVLVVIGVGLVAIALVFGLAALARSVAVKAVRDTLPPATS